MSVRAKFKVQSKKELPGSPGESQFEIELWPVTSGSAENEAFYKYTPAGKVELSTINADAAAQFKVGTEYYVDFTPAP